MVESVVNFQEIETKAMLDMQFVAKQNEMKSGSHIFSIIF